MPRLDKSVTSHNAGPPTQTANPTCADVRGSIGVAAGTTRTAHGEAAQLVEQWCGIVWVACFLLRKDVALDAKYFGEEDHEKDFER